MLLRKLLAALLPILVVGCAPSLAPTSPAAALPAFVAPPKPVTDVVRSAREDLFWLADDAREGRGVGTKGLDDSAEFIAQRFAKLGLAPLPALGGYFQPVDFDTGDAIGPGTRLFVNGTPLAADAFTPFARSKAGPVNGKLAFVGYAITSKEHDYDDFAGIDVKGRVVLAMRWEPHGQDGKSRWSKRDYTADAAIARKIERATEAGAAAFILVNPPTHHDDVDRLLDSTGGPQRRTSIPVFHVTTEAADQMLAAAGAPDLATLQHDIDATGRPASRLLDDATIDANVELIPKSSAARNVIAMLPGRGPHADEFVVIGAHYDHVGLGRSGSRTGAAGQIHNGADDNASGTVTLLELAEEFTLLGPQDRSILFASFTLEEVGLVGSEAFIKHCPVSKDKIVAMLNFDMVGRMANEFVFVGGTGTASMFDPILAAADARSPIELHNIGRGGLGPSDHSNFSKEKIPTLFFFTGMHSDYHAPGDDAPKINYDGIAQLTSFTFDIVRSLCAMPRSTYISRFDSVEPDTDVKPGELPNPHPRDR